MLLVTLNNAGFETIQAEDGVHGLEVLERPVPTSSSPTSTCRAWTASASSRASARDQRYRAIPILVLTTESDAEKKNRARDGRRHRLDREAVQSRQAGRRDPPRRRLSLEAGDPSMPMDPLAEIKDDLLPGVRRTARRAENPACCAMEAATAIRRPSTPSSAPCTRSRAAPAPSGWRRWCASRTSSRRRSTTCAPTGV